jgi:hypothetical protein
MYTTHHLQKNYVHNLSLEKKLYTQVILQTVVHTSCTYKLCAYQTYTQNFLTKFYISKLCIKVVYINYDFSETKIY